MNRPIPDQDRVRPGHPLHIGRPLHENSPQSDIRYGHTVTDVDASGNLVDSRRPVYVDADGRPTDGPQAGGYVLPPGVVNRAASEAAQIAKPSTVDQIADDADAAKKVPDWPPGSPEMVPFYRLSFGRRGKALRMFAKLEKIQIGEIEAGKEPTIEQAAGMFERLEQLDEFLATVAKDEQEYRVWVEGPGNDTEVFGQFWAAYQARFQPGEAERSSS